MVLLITHDETLGRQVTQWLEETGHPTSLSCTGREGIERVREKRPTLVVLDLYLEKPRGSSPIPDKPFHEQNLPIGRYVLLFFK